MVIISKPAVLIILIFPIFSILCSISNIAMASRLNTFPILHGLFSRLFNCILVSPLASSTITANAIHGSIADGFTKAFLYLELFPLIDIFISPSSPKGLSILFSADTLSEFNFTLDI